MMKSIVPAYFRGEKSAQDLISSSFLPLSRVGVGHRLEVGDSRWSWGAVGVCPGPAWVSSLRSPAEIGQGREGSPACRQPAEELREKVSEPREEREKVRNGEPRLQPSPPAFLITPTAASLPGHRSEPAPGEAAAPWQAAFFQGKRLWAAARVSKFGVESASLIWHLRCRLARGRYRGTAWRVGQQSQMTTVP